MLNRLATEIHAWAKSQGFYDNPREFGTFISLVHSELSEALEEWRDGHGFTEIYHTSSHKEVDIETAVAYGWKPEGIPIELADTIIRLLDLCAYHEIDIERAIRLKMAYNKQRPFRNGGKLV